MIRCKLCKRTLAVGCVLAAALTASVAWATDYVYKSNAWQAVSGSTGTMQQDAVPGEPAGLVRLTFYEHLDDPYHIDATFRTFRTKGTWAYAVLKTGTPQIKLDRGSPKTITVGDHYANAIQVCTNGNKNTAKRKIKGARLYGKRMNSKGQLYGPETVSSFQRPHCKTWERRVACPVGQVITGLRGYAQAKGYIGLAPRCSALQPK